MADNKTTPTPAPGLDLDAAEKRAAGFPGAHAYRGLLVKARAEIARLTAANTRQRRWLIGAGVVIAALTAFEAWRWLA